MKTFTYAGELYIRLIPSKRMFNSTLVHEVVNRGDVFAMRVSDQQFTVVPGTAVVQHTEHELVMTPRCRAARELAHATGTEL